MSTTTTSHSGNTNSNSSIKEEILDEHRMDLIDSNLNETENKTMKEEDVIHEHLEHKLLVQSDDGKIKNLLCPIELVLESKNFSAPLIPTKYESEIFCLFENVSSNQYKASTPKTSSRKRKNDSSMTRNPKKRKKMHHHHHHKHHKHRDEDGRNHEFREEDYFTFQPELNVNSRPKRQRKKVSYRDPDTNAIPIRYIPTKQSKHSKSASSTSSSSKSSSKSTSKSSSKSSSKSLSKSLSKEKAMKPIKVINPMTTRQPIQRVENIVENIVEMRWVQCDKCLKWRRIPTSITDKELEGEWSCSMNKWDLKRNSCSAEEEPYDLTEEQTVEVSNGADSVQNQKRKEFYQTLTKFYGSNAMKGKNLNINQLESVKIGNKNIDFLQLYLEVTKRGGYHYCITSKLFDEIFVCLQCYQSQFIKEANHKLQNLYATFLIDYERKTFNPYNN